MLTNDYLIGYLNAILKDSSDLSFREVIISLIDIITDRRDKDGEDLQQYLSKDWVPASIRPHELMRVHALITKADDTFLYKNGTYKYIEAEAYYDKRGNAGFRIIMPRPCPSPEEAENWKVMWWHYKSEPPMHLKPSTQENNNE